MMIDRFWGTYFGASVDSATLVEYLDTKGEIIPVSEIFTDLGLDALAGDYTQAELDAGGFHFDAAFHVVADLAVLLIESKETGRFNLARIGGARDRMMRIDAGMKENIQITQALKYFSLMPEEHSIAADYDDDALDEFGNLCEELRLLLD